MPKGCRYKKYKEKSVESNQIECVANKIIFLTHFFALFVDGVDWHFTSKHPFDSISFHSIHVSTTCIRFRAEPFHFISFRFILYSIKLRCTYAANTDGSVFVRWHCEWRMNSLKQLKTLAKSQHCMILYCLLFYPSSSEHTRRMTEKYFFCALCTPSPFPSILRPAFRYFDWFFAWSAVRIRGWSGEKKLKFFSCT